MHSLVCGGMAATTTQLGLDPRQILARGRYVKPFRLRVHRRDRPLPMGSVFETTGHLWARCRAAPIVSTVTRVVGSPASDHRRDHAVRGGNAGNRCSSRPSSSRHDDRDMATVGVTVVAFSRRENLPRARVRPNARHSTRRGAHDEESRCSIIRTTRRFHTPLDKSRTLCSLHAYAGTQLYAFGFGPSFGCIHSLGVRTHPEPPLRILAKVWESHARRVRVAAGQLLSLSHRGGCGLLEAVARDPRRPGCYGGGVPRSHVDRVVERDRDRGDAVAILLGWDTLAGDRAGLASEHGGLCSQYVAGSRGR